VNQRVSIDDRQRDTESGRLLRAFSSEYRRAKRYRALRFGVSMVLAVAAPALSLASLTAAGIVGATAGVWVVASRLVLIPIEQRHVRLAVRIQERFDCRLFDLPWADSMAGPTPSEEDIADTARRLQRDARVARQHQEGWYPSTAGLAYPVDVLVAQWSSVAYGRHQSRAYFHFIAGAISFVVIGVVAVGIVGGMSLTDWLITFALPSLPAALDASELADAHRRMADRKGKNEDELLQPLWSSELAAPGALSPTDCRRVQDESFRLRSRGLQVPDWFFWRRRERSEANMHDAAAARRAQHFNATASSGQSVGRLGD
jgi:hypothetical protein